MAEKKPYSQDKEPIGADKSPSQPYESRTKSEMVTFSIRLPKEQKERLEAYLSRYKGQNISPFVRQLVTEWMVREKLW